MAIYIKLNPDSGTAEKLSKIKAIEGIKTNSKLFLMLIAKYEEMLLKEHMKNRDIKQKRLLEKAAFKNK